MQLENNRKALRKLVWVILITFVFVFVEIAGGLMSNSIAILSDAAHLTSDALGIAISIVALKIAENKSNDHNTFGYHRAEVLGALVSILFIWAVTIWLMIEATRRLWNPKEIDSELMLIVSGICLVFNLIQMSILHSKDMHDFAHAPGASCGHDHSHEEGDHHHHHDHDHPCEGHDHDHKHDHDNGHDHKHGHNHDHKHDHSHCHEHNHDEEQMAGHPARPVNSSFISAISKDETPDTHSEHSQATYTSLQEALKDSKPKRNLNVQAAYLHIIGDIINSLGVLIASLLIYFSDGKLWYCDPICTYLFGFLVFYTTRITFTYCI